jgi:HSP20 family protein
MSYPVRRSNRGGWDPFGELQALRSELGRLMGGALVGRGGSSDVDLDTTDDGWTVTARLPGVAPEEVAVEVDDRELVIRARSEAEVNADLGAGGGERTSSFEYRVALPADMDPEKVDAVMDHGLLTVRLPRASRPGRRTIAVGNARPGRQVQGQTDYVDVEAATSGPASTTVDTESGAPVDASDGGTDAGGISPADPAADREMHHPDAVDQQRP